MANTDFSSLAHIRCVTAAKTATTAFTEMYAESAPLSGRKQLMVFNRSGKKVYWSFSSTATAKTANAIRSGGTLTLSVDESIPVYFRVGTDAGTARLIISEMS